MKCVHQLQNTIEHLGLPHEDNVLVNTRSTRTNALMRWLGWQMQYHTAHPCLSRGAIPPLVRIARGDISPRAGAVPPTMSYLASNWRCCAPLPAARPKPVIPTTAPG